MLFSHVTLRKIINLMISPCKGDISNAIRSWIQFDLVLYLDVIWSWTQMSFGPGPICDPGPGQEATQSWTQIDKFIYPGLPLMKPHFHFTTAYKMSQFKHKQFYAIQASGRHLPCLSRNKEGPILISHSFLHKTTEAARTPATPQRSFTNFTLNSIPNINLRRIWANFNTANPAGQSHNPISAGRAHSTIFQVTESHKHKVTSGVFAAPAGQNTKAGLPPC